MAKRVARKIKRAGKVACQFKFTSTFEYIDLECKGGWRPDNLKVIWLRSHRRAQSMNVEWVCTDDKGPSGASGRAVFDPPISASLIVTLYKDSKKPYEEKEYKYYIENEGPGGKKILASFTCDMAEYAGIPSSRHALEMNFKPISSKIKKCYLGITLESEFIKQGSANDDDMQSTFSAVEPGAEEMVFADELEDDDDEDDLDEAATLGKKVMANTSSEPNDVEISLITLGTGQTLKRTDIDVQAPPPKPPRSNSVMDLLDDDDDTDDEEKEKDEEEKNGGKERNINGGGMDNDGKKDNDGEGKDNDGEEKNNGGKGKVNDGEEKDNDGEGKDNEGKEVKVLEKEDDREHQEGSVCDNTEPSTSSGDTLSHMNTIKEVSSVQVFSHDSSTTTDAVNMSTASLEPATNLDHDLSNQSDNVQSSFNLADASQSPSTEPETSSTEAPDDTLPTAPPTDTPTDNNTKTDTDVPPETTTTDATPDAAPDKHDEVLSWLQEIELVDSTDSPIGLDRLSSSDILAFYFSASWCPPCKTFLPNLKKFYSALKDNNKSFEMIYVSSDYSREEMVAYMEESSMPWTAIRYGHKLADKLRQDYTVRVIPILVIVSKTGKLLEENAKKQVDKAASASSATAACIQLYSNWVEKINPAAVEDEPVKQKTGIMTTIKKVLSKDESATDKKVGVTKNSSIDDVELREAAESKTPKSKINSGGNKEDLLRQLQEKENVIRQLEEVNLSLKHTNDDLNNEVRQLKSRVELLNEEVQSLRATDARKKEDDEMFREYLKLQGWLFKRGIKGPTANKWRRRYFRLDQGSKLYYYKNHTEGTPQGHIDLLKVISVMELTASHQDKNNASFNIECEGRTYQLQAYDEAEMRRWITAISKLKEFYRKQQSSEAE